MGEVTSNTGSGYSAAVENVTVPAGSEVVTYKDNVLQTQPKYLAIIFNTVDFSGGQFYLLLSQDGFASQSAGDVRYSPTLQVSTLTAAGLTTVPSSLGNFYYGTVGGNQMVVGPIAINVSNAYHYVKVYDGSTGAEAATAQKIIITPGILMMPNFGPALTSVKVQGGGFPLSKNININYTFPFYKFVGGLLSNAHGVLYTGVNTGPGYFTTSTTPIPDTAQSYNPTTITNKPTTLITVFAVNATHVSSILSNNAFFTEYNRYFHQVETRNPSGIGVIYNSGVGTFGNDTGAAPILGGQPINSFVFSPVIVAGTDFAVSSTVTFWIGTTQLSSTVSTTSSSGGFNTTLMIPVLPTGTYTLVVLNDGVKYTFGLHINPTMILTPPEGTASNPNTTVKVQFYGFPAKTVEYIYWDELAIYDGTEFNVVNVTTTSSGETNTSLPYSFVVPEAFGGSHYVTAFAAYHGVNFSDSYWSSYCGGVCTYTTFYVMPSMIVTPNSFNSTYGGNVQVIGEGLVPGYYYSVNIDNQMADFALAPVYNCYSGCDTFWTEGAVAPGANGVLTLNFIGAGFAPGLHVVSLTSANETGMPGNYAPDIYALFTVTPVGNWEYNMLSSIQASIATIANLPTTLQGEINNAVTSINDNTNSQVGTLSTSVEGWINGAVTSINSNTNSQVSSLTAQITTLSTNIQGWITSATSSINSHTDSALATIASDVSTIKTDVAGISGVSGQATNILNAVNTEQTYVLVVAVLAAIILVLVLAVLIRKLS